MIRVKNLHNRKIMILMEAGKNHPQPKITRDVSVNNNPVTFTVKEILR